MTNYEIHLWNEQAILAQAVHNERAAEAMNEVLDSDKEVINLNDYDDN